MDRELTPLRALGARIAALQDSELARSDARARARTALCSGLAPRRAPLTRYVPHVLGFAACAAAVVLVSARMTTRGAAQVSTTPMTVENLSDDSSWVAATSDSALPLRFSDGSEVTLARSARARIVSRTSAGARIAIERGEVHAQIRHRTETVWRFDAGPYDVRVTGTAFVLAWDPADATMVLRLVEGSVVVTGCDLKERRVVAGEELRARCDRDSIVAPSSSTTTTTLLAAPSPEPPLTALEMLPSASRKGERAPALARPAAGEPPQVTVTTTATVPAAPTPAPSSPSWRELAATARYEEAYAAAEREGLALIAEQASSPELLAIADAARLTRHVHEAATLLAALRRRFPGSPDAAVAAFLLGRSALDERRAYAEAATWFETSARERPDGPLSREALGLVVEASDRSGDTPRARRASAAYLQRFPTGPHAELARRVLARGTESSR